MTVSRFCDFCFEIRRVYIAATAAATAPPATTAAT